MTISVTASNYTTEEQVKPLEALDDFGFSLHACTGGNGRRGRTPHDMEMDKSRASHGGEGGAGSAYQEVRLKSNHEISSRTEAEGVALCTLIRRDTAGHGEQQNCQRGQRARFSP